MKKENNRKEKLKDGGIVAGRNLIPILLSFQNKTLYTEKP